MNRFEINCTTGEATEVSLTPAEIAETEAAGLTSAWEMLRQHRNALLAESDWTQANDSPVDKYAWAEYRQQLRDLPANTTDPLAVVWPTPPA